MRQQPSQAQRRSSKAWAWLGVALLVAVLAPLLLWRASLETSFWIDETYSVLLTTYPVGKLIELTAADAHPPLYYLALKTWIKLGRLLGVEVGVLWSRLLNLAAWLAGVAAVWWGGRRILGAWVGAVLAFAVAGSAVSGLVARDLRSYAFAVPALVLAFLCLLGLSTTPLDGRRQRVLLWAGFVAASGIAVWSHLLSALVLAVLLPLWLALELPRSPGKGQRFLEGLLASLLVIVAFTPWLPKIGSQLASVESGSTAWMTAPTLGNWLLTFTLWYPFGRIGYLNEPTNRLLLPLGVLAVLVPLLAFGWTFIRPGSRERHPSLERLGALGVGTALLFVTLLWVLTRLDLAPVFDGPRYPILAANLWVAGLVGLSTLAASRLGKPLHWSLLLLAPWLACSLVGQAYLGMKESTWGVANRRHEVADLLPTTGEPLYVMPSELIPFYRRSLAEFEVRGVEALPCAPPRDGTASVLDVNFWKNLDRPRDHLARALIEAETLSTSVRSKGFPEPQHDYRIYRLDGLRTAPLEALCRTGFSPKNRGFVVRAASSAVPEDQPPSPSWSYLELNPELEIYRWATSDVTRVHFDRPLEPGTYTLLLEGLRTAFPEPIASMAIQFEGETAVTTAAQPEGRFRLALRVDLKRRHAKPILEIRHPTWRPAARLGSPDSRTLSFLFYGAWLEPERSGRVLRERTGTPNDLLPEYDLHVRYMLHRSAAVGGGLTVGTAPSPLTIWSNTTPGYTVLRQSGNYDEREKLLARVTATGGVVRFYIDNQGLNAGGACSGYRLVPVTP